MARTAPPPALIDITMPFGHAAGTWPGDSPFEVKWTGRIGDGAWAVNLTRFSSSPHNGTHSDAPFHVDHAGATSESLPLEPFLGPCRVVDATGAAGPSLPAELAAQARGATRVLFRTHGRPPADRFDPAFRGLSVDLARSLVEHGARLVGTDAPSVETYASKGLETHKVLLGAGAVLLENLDLSRAPAGEYELVALPLKVAGLCAAPVRALLRRLP